MRKKIDVINDIRYYDSLLTHDAVGDAENNHPAYCECDTCEKLVELSKELLEILEVERAERERAKNEEIMRKIKHMEKNEVKLTTCCADDMIYKTSSAGSDVTESREVWCTATYPIGTARRKSGIKKCCVRCGKKARVRRKWKGNFLTQWRWRQENLRSGIENVKHCSTYRTTYKRC